ncbi:unnamed protein product [Lactuca virosa]|uniref:Uncharacterized protein n=1 Tax=Lactuca virosa TaxID=75947 RepID=A0AAU9PS01_9ASTR|nr:unnamed protein product [Lactuca virosa]
MVRAEATSPSKGSGVPCFQFISRRWSAVADSALGRMLVVKLLADTYVGKAISNLFSLSHMLLSRLLMAACVAASVERGKQAVLVLFSGSGSGPSESGVVVRSTDAMHASIRAFVEIDFASYLWLGDLGLADLRQLCPEEEDAIPDDGVKGGM